jgi:hypothetical protein
MRFCRRPLAQPQPLVARHCMQPLPTAVQTVGTSELQAAPRDWQVLVQVVQKLPTQSSMVWQSEAVWHERQPSSTWPLQSSSMPLPQVSVALQPRNEKHWLP